jgi:hypothetical protein
MYFKKPSEFVKEAFNQKPEELSQWVNRQEELLLNDQAEIVIANISLVSCKKKRRHCNEVCSPIMRTIAPE